MQGCDRIILDELRKLLSEKGYRVETVSNTVRVIEETAPQVFLEIRSCGDRIIISLGFDIKSLIDVNPDEEFIENMQRTVDELLVQADYIGRIISPTCRVEKDLDSVMDVYQNIDNVIEEYS
ncbi:MAG: hypothetical protein F7B60_06460 [Desulfurococcales archaeon]|nr:hypothetical protein [Desulfurococcales archaeon]